MMCFTIILQVQSGRRKEGVRFYEIYYGRRQGKDEEWSHQACFFGNMYPAGSNENAARSYSINHRTSLIQKFFCLFFHICREIDPIFMKHIHISRQNCVCIHFTRNAASRDHLKLSGG